MRWSDDPKIREGLTSFGPVVQTPCERMEPIISDTMTQCEAGQAVAFGLGIIINSGNAQTIITKERIRIAQSLKATML